MEWPNRERSSVQRVKTDDFTAREIIVFSHVEQMSGQIKL
jgi:hypothetical protein